ncbi:MAG: branched-chain amino acid aminotransferase [Flavobacteriales bacterium]|nr:branched-chain amino acid aminotransferase [Crocinitomicaceae bacterium]NBX80518.1 branched-chain amino acid aminotransferase [Flavobacteriales bacterium]NCA20102.1 branched-chain amino acid aminotransferase [Crocinitomicaceae bacterium]
MSVSTLSFSIQKSLESKINQVDWDNLPFGKVFSDHMFLMEYRDGAWQEGSILPFAPIPMHPAMSAIHYGQTIFEGLKAYRWANGDVSIFRPDMNAKRFAQSAKRMCMPEVPEDIFIEAVRKLVEIDADWVTDKNGCSLYIRPFLFATDELVGIKPSDTYKFMIITSPVGAYYSEPVRVKIEEHYTRAAEGGVGRAKAAGNYGSSLYPAKQCQLEGFHQLVWTDAKEHKFIEESGTMNIVFQIGGKLITPTEDSDTILRGITKRSLIDLVLSWGIEVEERKVSVEEIITAAKNGTLEDAFGAGTAATIAQIAIIGYRDERLELPAMETRTLSNKIKEHMDAIKLGEIEDTFGWNLKV